MNDVHFAIEDGFIFAILLSVVFRRAACVGAAAKIRLVVDGVYPSILGQVEATVLANVLVRNLQKDEAANGRFATALVNKLGDGPFNTILNGPRDAGMAENIKILMAGKIPTAGVGVFWAPIAYIGRIGYLDGDPIGFLSTWVNTGSIFSTGWVRVGSIFQSMDTRVRVPSFVRTYPEGEHCGL